MMTEMQFMCSFLASRVGWGIFYQENSAGGKSYSPLLHSPILFAIGKL